ncbi:MAG: transketolase C-terminal domain-containing protein [Synergistaceae bacterium]|nr:transketolase C-terminal domain-containing protein [Synergistaceae bacterium]
MDVNNMQSTFDAFCELIAEYARDDGDFVLLSTGQAAENELLDKIPEGKFIKTDSSAPNVLLRAAGLALAGKKPWLLGGVAELAGGGYRHIREAIAMAKLPVRIAAADGGLSCSSAGAASQLLCDIALIRTIPEINLFVPSDRSSLKGIIARAANSSAPFYMRLGRTPVSDLDDSAGENFRLGGARILRPGTGVTICACGIMVRQALAAGEQLERQNISAEVIDCYCLKPFPEQALLSSVRKTGCCVVAEEHGGAGGLFGLASECLGAACPVPLRSVAAPDEFINSGTPEELREYYGLTWKEIVDAAAQAWVLRRR